MTVTLEIVQELFSDVVACQTLILEESLILGNGAGYLASIVSSAD
jgi:hypothetical protein